MMSHTTFHRRKRYAKSIDDVISTNLYGKKGKQKVHLIVTGEIFSEILQSNQGIKEVCQTAV